MAKLFAIASLRRYIATAVPIPALPCSIAAWVFTGGTGANRTVLALDTEGGSARVQVTVDANNKVNSTQADSGGTTQSAVSTAGLSASTWTHVGGQFISNTSRKSFFNGVHDGTNTVANTFTAPDRVRVGARFAGGSEGNYFDQRIAHLAIWDFELTAADWEMLAAGANPLTVRPQDLVFYDPMDHDYTNMRDIAGGLVLTPSGGPVWVDGPPRVSLGNVIPIRPRVTVGGATAVASPTTPYYNQLVTVTVAGLPADTVGTIEVGTAAQSVQSWSVSGGAGTITFVYDGRTNNPIGTAKDLVVKIAGSPVATNALHITPSLRPGFTSITLSGAQQSDPALGLSTIYSPDLVSGDYIEYQSPAGGGTITIDVAGQPSAGVGYIEGSDIITSGYDVSTGVWEDLTFALTTSGISLGNSLSGNMGLKSAVRVGM